MRYVVSAENYFERISLQEELSVKLNQYFQNIPISIFEDFNSIDFSNLGNLSRKNFNRTSAEVLDHQLFLIDKFNSIPDILLKEDFLVRAGYDTIELRLNESYLETLELLNEGVIGAVGSFLKALVDDPDPLEMTLNIIRLVLDVIGLVPFTWGGVPIDIVANVLSALISLYKEEYFSMALSILAAIDMTQATDLLKVTFGPISKLLEPVLKVLCRSGSNAASVETAVIGLKDGIIRIGQGGLIPAVSKFFKSMEDFIGNIGISVVRLIASFMDKVLGFVTLGEAKYIGTIKSLVDGIVTHLTKIRGNFDTASKMLAKKADVAVKPTDTVVSKKGKKYLAGSPQGGAIVTAKNQASKIGAEYLDDLTKLVKDDAKFMKKVANLPEAERAAAIAAKIENELIGQTNLVSQKIMKDPKLAKHLAEKYGWVPGKNYLLKLAKSGDVDGVKRFFDVFLSDSKISKNLTAAERRALTPFKAKPEAFVAGIKNFDDTVKMLERVAKSATKSMIQIRAIQTRRLINLMLRLFWQRYGSLDCIIEVGANKIKGADLLGKTMNLAKSEATSVVNEETSPTGTDAAEKIKAASKKDCGKVGAAALATVGHIAFPGSTATFGGTMNIADDPKKAAEFQEKSTEYSKAIVKSFGLDDSIDVQHALEYNDPEVEAYFADVFYNGEISINQSTESRIDQVLQRRVEAGDITQEEADLAKKRALEMIESGDEPEIKLPPVDTNEGLFKYKGFNLIST